MFNFLKTAIFASAKTCYTKKTEHRVPFTISLLIQKGKLSILGTITTWASVLASTTLRQAQCAGSGNRVRLVSLSNQSLSKPLT